jgi:hypothetical protein
MTDTAVAQQSAALGSDGPQPAASGCTRQLPHFNCRITTNFGDDQLRNIQILKQRTGSNESALVRLSLDVFSYLNGLDVESDAGFWVSNYFANNLTPQQNGDR